MLNKRIGLITAILSSVPFLCMAQAAYEPKLTSTGQVVEEVVYPIRIFKYEPPLDLATALIPAKSAEGVVAAWIAAMRRGDFDGALRLWDASSQAAILDKSSKDGKTKEAWAKRWVELFGERKVRAVNQVRFESALLIEYEIVDRNNNIVNSESVVLTNQDGNWSLTLKYANHAVLQGWKLPNRRVQRLAGGR